LFKWPVRGLITPRLITTPGKDRHRNYASKIGRKAAIESRKKSQEAAMEMNSNEQVPYVIVA